MAEPAQVTFDLSKDEAARAVVDARISATAILQCQRCLQDMEWPLATSTLMACVWTDEEAAALPAPYEPLLVEDDAVLRILQRKSCSWRCRRFPARQ